MSKEFLVLCAWCGKYLHGPRDEDAEVSHGICEECTEFFSHEEAGQSLGKFLEGIGFPVLVVDSDVRAIDGNREALNLVGKASSAVSGFKGGDIFECAYAKQPEGCGGTVHCLGCVVRNSITHTFKTGEPLTDVPCVIRLQKGGERNMLAMKISTTLASGMVLLKIDDIGYGVEPDPDKKD